MKRSWNSIKKHYEEEKQMAEKLKNASRSERRQLYSRFYTEQISQTPDHPQRDFDIDKRRNIMSRNLQIIRHFLKPGGTFVEIGAGDAALTIKVAQRAGEVIAVDVTDALIKEKDLPDNFSLIISDGVDLGLAPGCADLVFSHQLMEHLHPEDATGQLKSIYEALKPKGYYICITPSRIYGPHDVSKYFDDKATGFHLKEYTYYELERLFRSAGFKTLRAVVPVGKKIIRWPLFLPKMCEHRLEKMHRKKRLKIASFPLFKLLLGGSNIRLIAGK